MQHYFSSVFMWIEYLSYIVAFIVSAGMSAIGILLSYQMYQYKKHSLFATLLYYQIFLFSFLFYSIWGNMALRAIVSDITINNAVRTKLAFFIPLIGIPFMLISWFMLIRFAFHLNGYKFRKVFIYGYFPTLVALVFGLAWLIQNGIITIPHDADLFIVRILVGLNLVAHIFFVLPFIKSKPGNSLKKEVILDTKWAFLFLGIVLIYSAALSFINVFGFISICFSIVLLFCTGVFIPLVVRFYNPFTPEIKHYDFGTFCRQYDISKREAEIIGEICSGKTNKAIAEKLFITLQTVKDHNHRIFTKTGVKSRVQLSNLVREKTRAN